jgi:hypothetical protein
MVPTSEALSGTGKLIVKKQASKRYDIFLLAERAPEGWASYQKHVIDPRFR